MDIMMVSFIPMFLTFYLQQDISHVTSLTAQNAMKILLQILTVKKVEKTP